MADSTFADMQARMADELQRTDLADQIANAITEACDYYRRDAFFKNDAQATQSTSAGLNIYSAPLDIAELRALFATVSGTVYKLHWKTWDQLNAEDSNQLSPVQGPPVDYALNLLGTGMQLRLFPTPDAVYTLTYNYIQIISPPVNDTDSNFWTVEARELIRAYARYLLRLNVLNDGASAAVDKTLADEFFRKLKLETGMKKFTGRLRPWW
ncbi:MAG TPA: hypothetical protein VKV28_04845 [Candidatus Binataceae bacterium]|nr:hypothetical protein [Candidatus Binataceae bacterium]